MQLQTKYKLDLQKLLKEASSYNSKLPIKSVIWKSFLLGQMSEQEKKRTLKQNSAMHKYFTLLAEGLNAAGLTVKKVLARMMDFEWTPYSVKEGLWKTTMKNLFGKTSTTELLKDKGEIDQIHQHLTRFLGQEFGFENPEFPSEEQIKLEASEESDSSLIPF